MIDLDDLVKNGNMAHNHYILGGDVIFIPQSGQCFVDGAVRKPGTYPLSSNMTVTEAITLAGGLASWADDDKIKLIRYLGRGKERQVVSLSYSDLQAGIGDTLMLQDQDIIYAESSASGKFFSGTGFTLGFMGTGINFRNPEQ
jgi:polysaccharide export outer membrane protein